MIRVAAIGFKNSGRPQYIELSQGATIADLAAHLSITASQASFTINGNVVSHSTTLNDGDNVSYTMTNIKGA